MTTYFRDLFTGQIVRFKTQGEDGFKIDFPGGIGATTPYSTRSELAQLGWTEEIENPDYLGFPNGEDKLNWERETIAKGYKLRPADFGDGTKRYVVDEEPNLGSENIDNDSYSPVLEEEELDLDLGELDFDDFDESDLFDELCNFSLED
ncbi:MAG: hypothetical protein SAL07_19680 [Oscillatoria sp. PMC 1051.18]|nr:hypothetical protein [Oscillatoria sp. PMC 1050.18]MEC5032124.1 hypothetical protein [Oscillatoria sp. PMC 1051.18]